MTLGEDRFRPIQTNYVTLYNMEIDNSSIQYLVNISKIDPKLPVLSIRF